MRFAKPASLAGTLLLTLAVSTPANADHSWGGYHWEQASNDPVGLTINYDLTNNWVFHLDAAVADWNASPALTLSTQPNDANPRNCKAPAGAIQVCNGTYVNSGWLGVAGIAVQDGHITSGYTKLNDFYFDSTAFGYNTPTWRQLVMCQELGHDFGLGHQNEDFSTDETFSCMEYTDLPAGNEHPDGHDYEQLGLIYNHTHQPAGDGGDSGDSGGSGCNPRSPKCNASLTAAEILANIEMNGPAQWGRLVSAHGPKEVYELDFGQGRKIITHVTWTLEHAEKHEH